MLSSWQGLGKELKLSLLATTFMPMHARSLPDLKPTTCWSAQPRSPRAGLRVTGGDLQAPGGHALWRSITVRFWDSS